MSNKNGRDYLFLIWKSPKTKSRYIVGELSKNGQYEFSYGNQIPEAINAGFELLIPFPNLEQVYHSNDHLFPVFSSRLPDPKRTDIKEILAKYGLENYDAYNLLKASGARLPIDNLEFIDPIFPDAPKPIIRRFYLAGTGYHLGCAGTNCEKSYEVQIGDQLQLVAEHENIHDPYAIKLKNEHNCDLGFLPRYYSQGVSQLLNQGKPISCTVIEVNKGNACSECIKVELIIHPDFPQS